MYVEVSALGELATGSREHSVSHLTVHILLTLIRHPHKPPHMVQGCLCLQREFPSHAYLSDYYHYLKVKPHLCCLCPRLLPNSATITKFLLNVAVWPSLLLAKVT